MKQPHKAVRDRVHKKKKLKKTKTYWPLVSRKCIVWFIQFCKIRDLKSQGRIYRPYASHFLSFKVVASKVRFILTIALNIHGTACKRMFLHLQLVSVVNLRIHPVFYLKLRRPYRWSLSVVAQTCHRG